jgi:prophage regulatory protein
MNAQSTFPRRAIRIRKTIDKTGLGSSSIWRLVRKGQFPAPIKLSPGCTAWFEHEIDAWLDAKGMKRAPQYVQD